MTDAAGEEALDEFLEGETRAEEWREYRKALGERLRDAIATRDAADPNDPEYAALTARVEELREQVRVLAEEEAITQFVEDSVRASLSRPAIPQFGDEFDLDEQGYP